MSVEDAIWCKLLPFNQEMPSGTKVMTLTKSELESIVAMQVELGAAKVWETLRQPAPTTRIRIRPGYIFELQSTEQVTSKLTDAMKCEKPFLLTVRIRLGRHGAADNRYFVHWEIREKWRRIDR